MPAADGDPRGVSLDTLKFGVTRVPAPRESYAPREAAREQNMSTDENDLHWDPSREKNTAAWRI